MPRRPHLRAAGLTVVAALCAATLLACGSGTPSTPDLTSFKQTAGAAASCRTILSALPQTLNQNSPLTSQKAPFGAVWGNPGIVLRCGVVEPTGFTSNSYASCLTVNGVDWYLTGDSGNGADPNQPITVTTVYRSPAIEVTVPANYGTQGPSTAMALLAPVIQAHTKVQKRCV